MLKPWVDLVLLFLQVLRGLQRWTTQPTAGDENQPLSLLCARRTQVKNHHHHLWAHTGLSLPSFAVTTHLFYPSLAGIQKHRYFNALFSFYNSVYCLRAKNAHLQSNIQITEGGFNQNPSLPNHLFSASHRQKHIEFC